MTTGPGGGPAERRKRIVDLRAELVNLARDPGESVPADRSAAATVFPNILSPMPRPSGFVSVTAQTVTISLTTNDRNEPQYGRVDNGSTQGSPTQITFPSGTFTFATLGLPSKTVGDVLTIRVYGDDAVVSPDSVDIDVV